MSKRLTITLTDEEYATLEGRATAERRTPREMAEYLVTRPSLILTQPMPIQTIPQPWNPIWPPNTWCNTTTAADIPGVHLTSQIQSSDTAGRFGQLKAVNE